MQYWSFIAILICIVAAFAWQAFQYKRNREVTLKRHLQEMWGSIPEQSYGQEVPERITCYYKLKETEKTESEIDAITWNDLNMDQVFSRINYTESSAGEEYLYRMLRCPLLEQDTLRRREAVISCLEQEEDTAFTIGKILGRLGRAKNISLYQAITNLKEMAPRKSVVHWLALVMLLAALGVLIWFPPVGIILLIVVIICNVIQYFSLKAETEPFVLCFRYIVHLILTAKQLSKLKEGPLKEYADCLQSLATELNPLVKGVGILATNQMTGGLGEIVMDYVRMLTHLDLIKFNQMLSVVQKKIDTVEQLYETVGFLDAMRSVASFRCSLQAYCQPEFQTKPGISFTALYHPLIAEPVKNSMPAKQHVLLTGSNASGKSTFLKTVAVNAILAQTCNTCLADKYQAEFYHIYSSMALRDSLETQESYYIVEVRSLKRILDAVKAEKSVLCFVDEVLRGTNTVERIAASSYIMQTLAKQGATCFAATHDIELTYILENSYANFHFREEIEADTISFPYRLFTGRATSRNAIRLLDMIGYEPVIVKGAQKMAETFMRTGKWEYFC